MLSSPLLPVARPGCRRTGKGASASTACPTAECRLVRDVGTRVSAARHPSFAEKIPEALDREIREPAASSRDGSSARWPAPGIAAPAPATCAHPSCGSAGRWSAPRIRRRRRPKRPTRSAADSRSRPSGPCQASRSTTGSESAPRRPRRATIRRTRARRRDKQRVEGTEPDDRQSLSPRRPRSVHDGAQDRR